MEKTKEYYEAKIEALKELVPLPSCSVTNTRDYFNGFNECNQIIATRIVVLTKKYRDSQIMWKANNGK